MQVARQMLWYPVAYSILVIPIAAARFSAFNGKDVPFSVTIFTGSIFMLSGFVNAILFTATRRVIHFPSSWKSRLFSFSRRGNDPEGDLITAPYYSTTTMTQIDEPDSPTARAPTTRGLQAPLNSTSPPLVSPSYTPFTPFTSQPNTNGGSLRTAQSAAGFGPQQSKRPQWVGHGRSESDGSVRSGSSAATLTIRDDPMTFSGAPLVKKASVDGRSGYPHIYGRERGGSEGSIQPQARNHAAPGSSSSSSGVNKDLPSLPTDAQ